MTEVRKLTMSVVMGVLTFAVSVIGGFVFNNDPKYLGETLANCAIVGVGFGGIIGVATFGICAALKEAQIKDQYDRDNYEGKVKREYDRIMAEEARRDRDAEF